LITLANINTLCAVSHKTSHLGVLVIRPEVEMQSALSLLALIKPDEIQPRQAIRLRADLELLIRGVDHNPTKSLGPPLPQGHRIYRVNNYLFPFQSHPPSLGPVRRILPDRPLVPRRAQRLSVKVKWPESLPLSRTAETSFPSVISLSTSARERPQPSAISRTGRTGIRAAKRTETSITSRSR
jgi:hypothetical protein